MCSFHSLFASSNPGEGEKLQIKKQCKRLIISQEKKCLINILQEWASTLIVYNYELKAKQ